MPNAKVSEQAGLLDIELNEGSDFQVTLTWKDENDAAINLTGYTAKMHVRPKAGETGTASLELTHSSGLTLGGAAGTIIIDITDTQNSFGGSSYVYDLELTDSGGSITKLLRGNITSITEVTK